MRRIKQTLLALAAAWPLAAPAAGSGVALDDAGTDIHSTASLQRGARNFVNYCLGCHSAQYVRWNRVAQDLGLTEAELKDNLMFTGGPVHGTVRSSMPPEQARAWFGNAPPDLSLIARSRGLDWVYTFLRSYYADPARPTGVNNRVLPNTVMPHVLAHLQGVPQPRYELQDGPDGRVERHLAGLEPGAPGAMTAAQYDAFVRDLVNFLDYMGEPAKAQRLSLGVWVTLFLLVFLLFAWLLKKEYWKDVR